MQPGNEAMYAYPAAEMVRTGEYLVPHYEHGHFLEKPPLTWWALAASYKLFGVSLSSARLPGAVAAVLTALMLGVWVRRRSGDLAGAIAAMVLLFTFKFGAFARTSPADTLLAFFVTVSVIALDWCARDEGANNLWCGAVAGVALAFSFGTKGPIGVVLPVGAVSAGLAMDRRWPVRPLARVASATLLFLALVAPWHWAMSERLGATFWKSFYWTHQVLRGSTRAFCAHIRPPTYYLGIFVAATFPWFAFLPASWKTRRNAAPYGWLLFGVLFFSCLTLKREVYLMPLFPALAAIVGEHLGSNVPRPSTRWIWRGAALLAACLFLLTVRAAPTLTQLAGATPAFIFEAAFELLVMAFLVAGSSSDSEVSTSIACLGLAVVFAAFLILEARLGRWDPMAKWGHRVRGHCGSGCAGVRLGVTYTSLDFYSGFEWHDSGSVEGVSRLIPETGWVIADSTHEADLRKHGSVQVIDRQLFLDENWGKILLRPGRVSTKWLSLMTFEPSERSLKQTSLNLGNSE